MLAQMPLFHTLLFDNWALFETSLLGVGAEEEGEQNYRVGWLPCAS